jgi:phage tail sheath protein FI
MPSAPTYPGVCIEELPSGVRTITGVATSITAFIGRTVRGPVDEATTITNLLRPALPMSPDQHTSPPPVIHVTIGRVDVRAILPAPQTRRTSPQPAPRLSLEDYLKRRNGDRS